MLQRTTKMMVTLYIACFMTLSKVVTSVPVNPMYRLAQVSVNIIDQAVAQGVPFAREYSGLLDNRSFGGALVSRTFYAAGQTGQQLLLGAYQAHAKMVHSKDSNVPTNRNDGFSSSRW